MVIKQPNSAEGGCTRGELSIPIPVLKYIWYLAYNRELSGRKATTSSASLITGNKPHWCWCKEWSNGKSNESVR